MTRARRSLGIVFVALLACSTALAAAPPGQYVIATDTVADTKTGLLWQRNIPTTLFTLANANASCAALNLGGFSSGWRLPTRRELETLIDRTVPSPGPTLDATAFPNAPTSDHWTSTLVANNSALAWKVTFITGGTSSAGINNTLLARCVR